MYVLANSICSDDIECMQNFGIEANAPDKTLLPKALRRRAAMTTQMAVTAALHACELANADSGKITSVFASVGGEIQVTDALCRVLPDIHSPLSPTQFHNSVHNTTAGYWSIMNQCCAPTIAIAAAEDTFAMGLLEAWSQMQQSGESVLLVCYDELWPQYLQPPWGKAQFASAWVLSLTAESELNRKITLPVFHTCSHKISDQLKQYIEQAPAAAAIPLWLSLKNPNNAQNVRLHNGTTCWQVDVK